MIAKKGNAKTHAKWSPVATCIMRAEPIVELDQDKINQLSVLEKQELVERCPRKVFSYNDVRQVVDIEDASKCNLCQECAKFVNSDLGIERAIRIDENETKFTFIVESTGALPPDEIVLKAFAVLKQKLGTLKEYL